LGSGFGAGVGGGFGAGGGGSTAGGCDGLGVGGCGVGAGVGGFGAGGFGAGGLGAGVGVGVVDGGCAVPPAEGCGVATVRVMNRVEGVRSNPRCPTPREDCDVRGVVKWRGAMWTTPGAGAGSTTPGGVATRSSAGELDSKAARQR
jgi:hypothetical protein